MLLLLLQLQHEKLKQQIEADKQLTLERMKSDTQQARISLERERLSLIREGKLSLETGQSTECVSPVDGSARFHFVANLRLVSRFSEKDPETFLSPFERVADARGWPDADRTVTIQCVLTGNAQEAYSALSVTDGLIYALVKSAVLKAYEMVPEAYRQLFRNGQKEDKRSYIEFSRDLLNTFSR